MSNNAVRLNFQFNPVTGEWVHPDVVGVTDGYETDVIPHIDEIPIRGIARDNRLIANGRAGTFDFFGIGGFVTRVSTQFAVPEWLVVLLMVIATIEAAKELRKAS